QVLPINSAKTCTKNVIKRPECRVMLSGKKITQGSVS
ncbi:MAG: hypothetical protein ACI8WL_001344, partial [Polaribacter sp.]